MFDPTPLDRVRPRAPKGWMALGLSFAILLFASAATAETLIGPPAPSDVPVADHFVSPVGDPADFSQPAPGESHGYAITRGVQRSRDRHLGLDLSNRSQGGEVRAPADGVVIESRRYGGWGQLLVIAHRLSSGECVMSLLAHLKPGSVKVHPGDRVEAGQPLASVGRSGRASGPHLHFELRELGHADPWRTLWERSPVLDPLRLLGQRLAQTVFPRSTEVASSGPGTEYLRRLSAGKAFRKKTVGNPDAPLTRLEFYSWLDAASGKERGSKPTWNRIRHRLAARGVAVPSGRAMDASPVSAEEARVALSRLLAADRLSRVEDRNRVSAIELSRRGLAAPSPSLSAEPAWTVGPSPALTRGDGALLVLAARSWPFSAGH